MKRLIRVAAAVILTAAAIALTAALASHPAPARAAGQLVYICQQQPCANNQEFEVFDPNGAPIASVAESGGLGVFGDCYRDFGPGSVFNPAVVLCYTSPASYDRTFRQPDTCVAPARWVEPGGDWVCSAGTWVRASVVRP